MKSLFALAGALLLALSVPSHAAPTVVTYPASAELPATADYAVAVEGNSSFVYTAPDVGKYTVFSFGGGPVHVRVTTAAVLTTVDVRPKSLGIQPTFTAHAIDFDLAAPANISVEINGDLANPLSVFANPLEETPPSPDDPNVIFFAPGQVYNQDEILVPSGKTVYVAGGAYVKGRIRVGSDTPGGSGSSNVSIRGRGIVDATSLTSVRPARVFNSSSVSFDGPIFIGSDNFGVAAFSSSNLTFRNIKILNKELYGDGLDVVACNNVTIDGCFIRSGDDTIAVKTDKFGWSGGVDTVSVSNCVLWNGGYGKALQVGFETADQYIRNITFKNSDIIHKVAADSANGTSRAALSIETSAAVVSNISYEDIRIEDCTQNYISFALKGPTEIKDVYLKNVRFSGDAEALPVRLDGWDSTHQVSNVTFDHLSFSEGPVAKASQVSLISDNTSNIRFVGDTWTKTGGGTWSSATNWSGGAIASGVDHIADFSTLNLAAGATVTLDGSRTVGHLRFGDTTPSHDWTINAGTGGSLTLAVTSDTPTINVVNRTATIDASLGGTQDLLKTGAGALNLTGTNTYTGRTMVTPGSGLVTIGGDQRAATGGWLIGANSSAATTVTFAAGSQVTVAAGKELRLANTIVSGTSVQTLNVAGSVVNAGQLLIGRPAILNLNSGGVCLQSGPMIVAAQGGYAAKLNVAAGAAFTYSGLSTIKLNGAQGNSGQALLAIDGALTTTSGFEQTTAPSSGYGRVTLQNGGVLKLGANVPALSTGVQFVLGANGGVIDTNGYATSLSAGITGSNGFTKRGSGTLTMSGASTYTGATTIEGGILSVSGSLGNTATEIKNACGLSLNGNIGGSVTVRANARLGFALASSPASQPARTIGGTLAFDPNSIVDLSATTPPAPGTYVLANASAISGLPGSVSLPTLIAGNLFVQGASLRLTITATGYQAWTMGYNLGAQAGSNDDPDRDGIPNAIEFSMGTDPTVRTSSGIQTQKDGTSFTFIFARADESEVWTTLTAQWSTDLSTWNDVPIGAASTGPDAKGITVSVIENGAAPDMIAVTIPNSNGVGGRLWVRLRVTPL